MLNAVRFGTAALLALAVIAFWPMYLSRPFRDVDAYTHVHAALGVTWMVLVITQAWLIRAEHRGRHRLFGRVSLVLAPGFVVSGILLAHSRFSAMDAGTFAREADALYLPISAAALFAVAFGLAMRYRRATPLHARFIACTVLPLTDPVLGRVVGFYVVELPEFWHYQVLTFGLELLVLAYLCRTARSARDPRAFWGFAGGYSIVLLLWFWFPRTAPWLQFATWFRGLPLT